MHLTCPECGAPVEVTASFDLCPACNANVASQYTPTEMIRTVYHRALEHYSMGNDMAALEGIHQGIELLDAPELHLLAALIYRKRGDFKEMREHVSAIPADDVLRGEGEWLLRSHQEQLQQGRMEEARRRSRTKGTQPEVGKASRQFSSDYYPTPPDKNQDAKKSAPKIRRNRLPWAIPIAAALLIIIVFTQGAGDYFLSTLRQLRTVPDGSTSVDSAFTQNGPDTAPDTGAQISAAAVEDTPTPQKPTAPPPLPTLQPTPTPTPSPTAAPVFEYGAPDVAATIVAAARVQTFDLTAFLNGRNRPELATLGVQASWASGAPPGELILQGTVTLASDKLELVDEAAEIEDVTSINHDKLLVDLPETYTVRVGENLRHIAIRLYGDPDLWTEIYDANQNLIGSDPDNLWVGLPLSVPQLQQTQETQEEQSQQ